VSFSDRVSGITPEFRLFWRETRLTLKWFGPESFPAVERPKVQPTRRIWRKVLVGVERWKVHAVLRHLRCARDRAVRTPVLRGPAACSRCCWSKSPVGPTWSHEDMALCHFGAEHDGRTDTTVDTDVVEGDCPHPCGNLRVQFHLVLHPEGVEYPRHVLGDGDEVGVREHPVRFDEEQIPCRTCMANPSGRRCRGGERKGTSRCGRRSNWGNGQRIPTTASA
jgi:hypothetical protein